MSGICRTWMKAWCFAMIISSSVFVLAAFPATDFPARLFYDFVYWPLDDQSGFTDVARPTIAILGAVFLGWAIMLEGVIKIALDDPASPLWRVITTAVVVWYVADGIVSFPCGIPANVITNTLIFAAFLVPLLGSRVLKRGGGGPAFEPPNCAQGNTKI
jgi:hypothetical protein